MKLIILALCLAVALYAEDPKPAPTIEQLQQEIAQKGAVIKWLTDMLNTMAAKANACSEERQATEKLQQLQQQLQQDKK